jgi:hypothetical protein
MFKYIFAKFANKIKFKTLHLSIFYYAANQFKGE